MHLILVQQVNGTVVFYLFDEVVSREYCLKERHDAHFPPPL